MNLAVLRRYSASVGAGHPCESGGGGLVGGISVVNGCVRSRGSGEPGGEAQYFDCLGTGDTCLDSFCYSEVRGKAE